MTKLFMRFTRNTQTPFAKPPTLQPIQPKTTTPPASSPVKMAIRGSIVSRVFSAKPGCGACGK